VTLRLWRSAVVNRGAHKRALVCLTKRDNFANLACVCHAWNYELDGRLKSVAFRNDVRGADRRPRFPKRRYPDGGAGVTRYASCAPLRN
jgi:phenylpropionate dioxygenase-like ring-hydroxylating dioxygenase large terminal subunit